MEPSEAIKLRQLEDENSWLKKLVAEVCLDREMLKALLIKTGNLLLKAQRMAALKTEFVVFRKAA